MKMKRTIAAAAILMAACSAVRADVFDKAPADAILAIKVANLDQTNSKIAKLATDLGVAQFDPRMNDPLSAFLTQANMTQGVNRKGDFGIIFLPPAEGAEFDEQSIIMLVPTSDAKAFLANFGEATPVEGAMQVTTPEGETLNIADWNGYAAISQNLALLKAPAATLKLTGTSATEAAKQDFLMYANFSKLSPKLMGEVEKGLAQTLKEIEEADGEKMDPKYKPLARAGVTQVFGIAKTFLRDSNGGTVGATLTPAGLNFSAVGDFKPDSYLGKFASSVKENSGSLITGLPDTKYLFFGGSSFESPVIAQTINETLEPVVAELSKIEGVEQAKQLASTFQTALKATKGSVFGMPAPQAIGTDAVAQQIQIIRGGGQSYRTAFEQAGQFAKTFIGDLDQGDDAPKPTFTITPKAKTIDGVVFDQWDLDAPLPQDDPAAAQTEMMMNLMYGEKGLNYLYAPIGDDDFIVATSASDAALTSFIKAYKTGDKSVAARPHVKAVAEQLPKARIYEAYIALDEIVNTGVAVAQQQGMAVPITLPPDLAPIGVSFGAEKTAMRFDAHLPQSTLRDFVAVGMQFFMQMQGGGGGDAGGM